MGFIPNIPANIGVYIPTTDVYDLSRISQVDVNSEEFKLLLVRLYQNLNSIALALNLKESSYYILQEFVNGQLFFPDVTGINSEFRQDYRIVINIGALPAGTTTVAHNIPITTAYTFTRIYGTATDNTGNNFYPIPYIGPTGGAVYISLQINLTNVVINNQSGVTFNECLVILEYLKT